MTDVYLEAYRSQRIQPVILRLPCVYGPGDYQYHNRHGGIIRRIVDLKRDYLMGSIEQASVITHGYVENVAAAIVHASSATGIDGEIFNIGELKSRSKRRWAELYAKCVRDGSLILR